MHFQELCEKIQAVDASVRFAAVLTRDGRVVAGGLRPGVDPLEPPSVTQELDFQTAHYHSRFEAWERYFGELNYIFVNYRNLHVYLIPLGAYLLNVTTEPSFTFAKVKEIMAIAE